MSKKRGGAAAAHNRGTHTRARSHYLPDDSAIAAASLRSVLASMSDEELLRYKVAFQNADLDEDGYLDVTQAMKAMQSCGIPVSSNAMLDSLDELEVAQEDDMHSSEWEQEQNRRRRRRRRNSLESIEQDALWAHTASHPAAAAAQEETKQEQQQKQQQSHLSRGKQLGVNTSELDRVSSHSSLRSPSIDISTFLSLLKAPPAQAYTAPRTASSAAHKKASPLHSARHAPSSRNPLTSPQHPSQQQHPHTQPWQQQSYQNSGGGETQPSGSPLSRPLSNVLHSMSHATLGTSSPRMFPTLRLRDHREADTVSRLQIPTVERGASGLLSSLRSSAKGGGALTGAPDDDDDDDFNPEGDLLAAFYTFDPAHSGTMSVPHLQAILTHMGEKWSQEEAAEMVEEVDQMGEGRFNYRELVHKLMARE